MKNSLFALTLILLATGNTFACPILTGDYWCSNSQGKTIDANYENLGGYKYKLEDSVVQAGPSPVTEIVEGLGFRIETSAVCQGDTLNVVVVMKNAETLSIINQLKKRYTMVHADQLEINFDYIDDKQQETALITCDRK